MSDRETGDEILPIGGSDDENNPRNPDPERTNPPLLLTDSSGGGGSYRKRKVSDTVLRQIVIDIPDKAALLTALLQFSLSRGTGLLLHHCYGSVTHLKLCEWSESKPEKFKIVLISGVIYPAGKSTGAASRLRDLHKKKTELSLLVRDDGGNMHAGTLDSRCTAVIVDSCRLIASQFEAPDHYTA